MCVVGLGEATGDDAAGSGAGYASDIPARCTHHKVAVAIAGEITFHQERAAERVVARCSARQGGEVAGILPGGGDDVFVDIDAAAAAIGIGSADHQVGPAVAIEVARSERTPQTAELDGTLDAAVCGFPGHASRDERVVVEQVDCAELFAGLSGTGAGADGNHRVLVQHQSTAAEAGAGGPHHEGISVGVSRTAARTQGVERHAPGAGAFGRVARGAHDQLGRVVVRRR